VADASHELRTPLAIMKAEIELALARDRPSEELRAALLSAGEETDRLERLAEDLLVIARADRGRLPVRPEPLDVAELMEGTRRRLEVRAARLGRTVTVEAPADLTALADRLRTEQALDNLTDNALRHGAGAVALVARARDGGAELAVADDGEGFSPEMAERAFERFSRDDAARSGGGAGLGLAIVAAIARAHGGEAGLRSAPSGGAEAFLWLPAGPG
jgi:signal transduction histidine kinase